MESGNYSNSTPEHLFANQAATGSRSKSFIANVFSYMFLALAISAVTSYIFTNSYDLMFTIATNKLLLYGVMFMPLAFMLIVNFGFHKMSVPVLLAIFIAWSICIGISFSFILLVYTQSSILTCFLSAAAMFGIMAFMGYTTKQDLTSFGKIMMMGFWGIFAASLINFFMQNDTMDYIISFVGVLVFTGLTAYDMQKIKRIGEGLDENGAVIEKDVKKLSIMAGLTLYLDFINLFIMLLRLFGSRR
ncbi:MAG: Bax inhibitor-1/YccA family protein [Bacteroidetes bacterium]|nr:Bax inhibitor-1/YccA family protein [Bacteroidota bacterium]